MKIMEKGLAYQLVCNFQTRKKHWSFKKKIFKKIYPVIYWSLSWRPAPREMKTNVHMKTQEGSEQLPSQPKPKCKSPNVHPQENGQTHHGPCINETFPSNKKRKNYWYHDTEESPTLYWVKETCIYIYTHTQSPTMYNSFQAQEYLKPIYGTGFSGMWNGTFQMFKLHLEKAEEPEVKLPMSSGSSKKQESSRKTSTSALLTTPKPLTVWITTNCGKS